MVVVLEGDFFVVIWDGKVFVVMDIIELFDEIGIMLVLGEYL